MTKKYWQYILWSIPVIVLLAVLLYQVPFINQRLAWRLDNWKAQIKYALAPPEEEIFIPSNQQSQVGDATLQALTCTSTPTTTLTPTVTSTPHPEVTPTITSTSTPAPTSLPSLALLPGIQHEYQTWNNCGPANLSMSLSYWGWEGNQHQTAAYLKPNERDKNVMPYEMAAFVNEETNLEVLVRVGGNLQTLKSFIAAGFPILIETGFEDPRPDVKFTGWMGHYEVLNAYDDAEAEFYVQDSYLGPRIAASYQDMESRWRAFNYLYIIVYPPEKEADVQRLLGPHIDEVYNYQQAAAKASEEIYALTGRDKFFAWFNRGTNLVALDDYAGAAAAYDEAFSVYPQLNEDERPWRMMWYQTGPYWAYYYTGRYYDVLNLATQTIENVSEPAIEESWYWRALAREALGDVSGAISDLEEAVKLNENFETGWYHLNRLRGE
ncbi:MAG: hypothetical protein B6I38_02620 [Anaerolineaceae bacterium 4572_5.1]|nr:MAG: hypothetical protein B6I38_02620 [Anaerolineaceae bacterium 4572_5.1]